MHFVVEDHLFVRRIARVAIKTKFRAHGTKRTFEDQGIIWARPEPDLSQTWATYTPEPHVCQRVFVKHIAGHQM